MYIYILFPLNQIHYEDIYNIQQSIALEYYIDKSIKPFQHFLKFWTSTTGCFEVFHITINFDLQFL